MRSGTVPGGLSVAGRGTRRQDTLLCSAAVSEQGGTVYQYRTMVRYFTCRCVSTIVHERCAKAGWWLVAITSHDETISQECRMSNDGRDRAEGLTNGDLDRLCGCVRSVVVSQL